jgi:hypothetical protein
MNNLYTFNITSYTNSPSKGLYLYPIIPPLTSSSKNTSRVGPSTLRGSPTLSNIYTNILVL